MLSPQRRPLLCLALLSFLLALLLSAAGCSRGAAPAPNAGCGDYLFCFWNVENLFDDRADGRSGADREFDRTAARQPDLLQLKLARLADALLRLNDGKGPDILALVEVESVRAAELLRQTLNQRLTDESLHYRNLLMKEVAVGRHIAPAILTRLPVRADKTRLHGRGLRILEAHITVAGHDLVVLATHWTSRLTDVTGQQRAKYGDQAYGVFKAMVLSNPQVDFLVAGDCNDPPEADSITRHLHATGDRDAVRRAPPQAPLLFNLFAGKDPEHGFGTYVYRNQPFIFDQIFIAPGLLDDGGWSCLPETVQTVNSLVRPGDRQGRPWRFAETEKNGHGYSDHFPVTVRLKVQK